MLVVSVKDITSEKDRLGTGDDAEVNIVSGVGNRVGIKAGVVVGKISIMLVVSVKDITSEKDRLGTGDDAEVNVVSGVGNRVGIKTGVVVGKISIMLVVSVNDSTSEKDGLGTGDDDDVSGVGNKVGKIIVSVTSSVVRIRDVKVSEGSNVEGGGVKILIERVISEVAIGRSMETVDVVGLISREGINDVGEEKEMLVSCGVMSGPGVDVSGKKMSLDVMNIEVCGRPIEELMEDGDGEKNITEELTGRIKSDWLPKGSEDITVSVGSGLGLGKGVNILIDSVNSELDIGISMLIDLWVTSLDRAVVSGSRIDEVEG